MDTPPYWTPEIAALVQRRGPMPTAASPTSVGRWQSTYVRYKGQTEGQVCQNGWDQTVISHNPSYSRNPPSLRNGGPMPHGINMKILTAPAEFVVPVKQDRRLTPDFKVRVEVRYRGRVSFPLTVRAHILSQQEKDNLPEWMPEGMIDDAGQYGKPQCPLNMTAKGIMNERKPPTELKGTTHITHHFEANMSGALAANPHPNSTGAMQQQQQYILSSNLVGPPVRSNQYNQPIPQIVPSTVIQTPQYGSPSQMMQPESLQAHRYVQHQNQALLQQAAGLGPPLSEDVMNLDISNPFSLTSGTQSTLSSLGDFSDASNFAQMLQEILGEGEGDGSGMEFGPGITVKPEHGMYNGQQLQQQHAALMLSSNQMMEEDGLLTHDFEFLNLEFVKPTRMSKVYICFACTILDQDLLYSVYHIPTVGICRAEQRIKACEKLGIPRNFADQSPYETSHGPATSDLSGQSGHMPSVNLHSRKRAKNQLADSMDRCEAQSRRPFDIVQDVEKHDSSGTRGETTPLPRSRQALREWIVEEYESTGLKRRLTEMDLETLESQAGFPVGGGDADVAIQQWEEFTSQFRDVLDLLKRIASVWDLDDPCVISGLHIDRRGTVQALAQQPSGTFICRLSWTIPGSLVLSCKVKSGTPKADNDGLVHAIIRIDDLQERKVDTWIRDYPAATHVLDVYTCKRVDKRKVFVSNYMRIKFMDEIETVK